MTEKDELVEALIDGVLEDTNLELSPEEARAAIASIRPTIVEEVLRDFMNQYFDNDYLRGFVEEFGELHGLDLSQDGDPDGTD